ncbi:MAG: MiaB/RimO family radical SAM methylthiotransferase [Deltaproteobacteria bacterium]|nr:MiaB/RimO family radical SAM methylthiotransferase [Deltaproteobacteria bacterium]
MKAAVVTMGCRVNQAESQSLRDQLSGAGFELGEPMGADLVVLNTCSVTGRAEKEALSLLRRLRRQNSAGFLVAVGCLAQLSSQKLVGPELAYLALGQEDKEKILAFVPKNFAPIISSSSRPSSPELDRQLFPTRTRALLKIQDGCSQGCSYCVVPLARGPSRSSPPEVALARLGQLLENYREVVLTGVHLGHYGLEKGLDLGQFLALIHKTHGHKPNFRLRLSSLEPLEVGLVYEALNYGWLAPHIHAPLQSGSDKILKRMGRPYLRADYLTMAQELTARFGPIALGADVLVGFPGETEEDFAATYDLLANLPMSYLHVFPFSPRPGTLAANWEPVAEPVKKYRVNLLKKLNDFKKAEFLKTQYPLKHLALVENRLDAEGRARVLTGSYLKAVWAHPQNPPPNSLVWARLEPPDEPGLPPKAFPW